MEGLFAFVNVLPLPVWLSMILFPRARFTQTVVMSPWPFIVLAGVYLVVIVTSAVQGGVEASLSFDALLRLAASEAGFVAIWTHLLILDLFAGVWIFRDAKYWGIAPTPYLLLTWFLGPLGLGAYLFVRERRNRTDPVRNLN